MARQIFILMGILFCISSGRAQSLYLLSSQQPENRVYFSAVDQVTGITNTISSGLSPSYNLGASALDPVSKKFFYMYYDTIYTVDLITGNPTKNAVSTSTNYNFFMIEYNISNNILYGIAYKQSLTGNKSYLSSINPATGSVTIISPYSLSIGINDGISTLDPYKKRFFYSWSDTLYNIDLNNGTIISKPNVGSFFIRLLEFNCRDTTLYAITFNTSNFMTYLSTVNPVTGSVTVISPAGLSKINNGGISSIDPVGKKFYYVTDDTLCSVSLNAGALISKKRFFSAFYYTGLLEFEKSCSSTFSTEIPNYTTQEHSHNIFPNPLSQEAALSLDEPLENATMSIYNQTGSKVKFLKNISGQSLILSRENLPNGIYFILLVQDGKTVVTDKIMIID